ncbi:MAG: diguanylate cyclase domain-containing protein [Candidatus Sumerlaeia bacterium]
MLTAIEKNYAIQLFTREGKRLTQAVGTPDYCEAVAKTRIGKTVCNRGCGFSFALTDNSPPFQTFQCPFGVFNAILQLDDDYERVEPDGPNRCSHLLTGGRLFRTYGQFHRFVEKAAEVGASIDELLENCEHIDFLPPEYMEATLDDIARRLRAAHIRGQDLHGAIHSRARQIGVSDEASFEKRLREEIARGERFKHIFSMAMVRVNMSSWLPAGADQQIQDLVLKGVAGILKPAIRGFDQMTCYETGFRHEKDREIFCLLFPETDRIEANAALERLLGSAQERFLSLVPHQEDMTKALYFEIGIAEYPTDGTSLDELKELARSELDQEKGKIEMDPGIPEDPDAAEANPWLDQGLPDMGTMDMAEENSSDVEHTLSDTGRDEESRS